MQEVADVTFSDSTPGLMWFYLIVGPDPCPKFF